MKAIQYRKSVPRYAAMKILGRRFRKSYAKHLSPIYLCDLPDPPLPSKYWVRIAPRLAGVCGSDLSTICATGSPYLAPVTSMPFVLGHEIVGHVAEVGDGVKDLSVGDRVVLHPALGCKARGIDPLCDACGAGRDALCRNITRGDISKGVQTGFCRDTGGGFSQNFVAHRSQVYRVPESLDDRVAVLIEPFACALHGALRVNVKEDDTILVIGCGSIGLLTIAALRFIGCRARIVAAAKHQHQKEHALALGADEILDSSGSTAVRYRRWAKALDAEVLDPELGKPTVIGGAAATLDCVASSTSIDDGLRFTAGAGTFVLVGMPGIPSGVDWTPLWFKELTVHAAYAYGPERYAGGVRETFDIALELVAANAEKLAPLVGEPFELDDYRAAFLSALMTGERQAVKTIFTIENG